MPQSVYLSLGSNLGDRLGNLHAAVEELGRLLTVRAVSSIYATDPVGVADQPEFLNLALGAETDLDPHSLLREVKRIERVVGRRPTFRWGPRVVDIDILLHGQSRLETPELTIPHPEMTRRAFVLVPLAEIAPDAVLPTTGQTVAVLAGSVEGSDSVRRLSDMP